ncbi:hypothetical protein SLEP1_g57999 [Rubroshorea leprosula]|uniref:Uncharacterized protein n=1 Tax=Rubroshorea leprosula TaxID=152421 RepID=A0AAV5MN20_9ROSI|nr:hypothetical protein SLEP1_g57999 [Rubroshorea leprosula]
MRATSLSSHLSIYLLPCMSELCWKNGEIPVAIKRGLSVFCCLIHVENLLIDYYVIFGENLVKLASGLANFWKWELLFTSLFTDYCSRHCSRVTVHTPRANN